MYLKKPSLRSIQTTNDGFLYLLDFTAYSGDITNRIKIYKNNNLFEIKKYRLNEISNPYLSNLFHSFFVDLHRNQVKQNPNSH